VDKYTFVRFRHPCSTARASLYGEAEEHFHQVPAQSATQCSCKEELESSEGDCWSTDHGSESFEKGLQGIQITDRVSSLPLF